MSDILSYLELYPTDNKALFVFLISEMDSEYLNKKYGKKDAVKTRNDEDLSTMTGNRF